jgi:hypothetical protein
MGRGEHVVPRRIYPGNVRWCWPHQAPLVVGATTLDVVIDPAGGWSWKDEDDFAQATESGVFADDAAVRAEGSV